MSLSLAIVCAAFVVGILAFVVLTRGYANLSIALLTGAVVLQWSAVAVLILLETP